jgi:DNA-binding CsgD family transcriptional regulator
MSVTATGEIGVLLEREESLSTLDELLDAVRASRAGRLVLVGGEAGVGKTALLRTFGAVSREPVLWGTCEPLLAPRPLGPFIELAASLGSEFENLVSSGPRAHELASALIAELGEHGPTVVVIEDLHWADEATLDVLRLLGRRVSSVPTLLLASYRDDELDRARQLQIVLGDLAAATATRLHVEALSPEAVNKLAAEHDVDALELYRTTSGNPFFVTEVLGAGGRRMPETVRDAVLARAARLSESDRRLLQTVAVVPGQVEIWMLEALAGDLFDQLEQCLASGMLRSGPAHVSFRHELARLAIEESLPPDRRVGLHRRALVELASRAPDLARLAHHAEAAGDAAAVLRFAPAAATQASAAGAHREAERQYARALRFADGLAPAERADLLERFADECYLTDMRDEALDALDAALAIHRSSGDSLKEGKTQRLRSRLLPCAARGDEAWQAGLSAVALLEPLAPGPELALAYASLSGIAMVTDDAEETFRWGSQAVELAERIGATEPLVGALNNIGCIELARGLSDGAEKLERALSLAQQSELEAEAGRAYVNLAAIYCRRHDYYLADPHIDNGIEYCRKHGLEAWRNMLLATKGESELFQGHLDRAAQIATAIIDGPRDAIVGPRHGALITLGLVRARRGDPQYWPLLDEALELAHLSSDLQYLAPAAVARAEAAWLAGRPEMIKDATDQAFALALERGEPSFVADLARWRWRAGLITQAPANADSLCQLQIAGEWEQAAQLWRDKGCRYEAALALADTNQETALRQALGELQALSARPAAAIVARRLRAQGAKGMRRGPYSRTRANPAGLTARELDVLALVVDGLRNAQIAERLIVSEKTVDHHVSAILRKLGVRTRGQAATEAVRLGLINDSGAATTPSRVDHAAVR